MRQSKLFSKTSKNVPRDIQLQSHKLLYQAGFIRESVAGRYYFLPLGMRVRDKIISIVKEEMDRAGAQELITPVLHPLELWKETNRTNTTGFELMQVKDRRGADFALGGTAEEMMVDLVRKFQLSYKDLPFNIYQFGQKFRDEIRARGGLLRMREFIMKDAYSFHADAEDFKKEYENMRKTYKNIYKRLGLDTVIVEADNGYIGGDYCHEFVVESEAGESRFLKTSDNKYAAHEDVANFTHQDINQDEEIKEFQIIDQPEWVQNMKQLMEHYNEPKWRFLKNVVYKNRVSEEIIIATIRGDLEVNKVKLERALGMNELLEDASKEDLAKLGTKSGYVHSWGHKNCRYVGDESLRTVRNFIGGQKEETTDSINVNYGRDFEHEITADIAMAQDGFVSKDGQKLIESRGIEVGNIFQLGLHYSEKMNAKFIDQNGKEQYYYMGCYGFGIERTLTTILEKYHDEHGMMWPKAVAPFQVHLISLKENEKCDKIYQSLIDANIEVLYDDRDLRPGEKFGDSDLIGCPVRIVVSAKTLEQGMVEVKKRDSEKLEMVKLDELISFLKKL